MTADHPSPSSGETLDLFPAPTSASVLDLAMMLAPLRADWESPVDLRAPTRGFALDVWEWWHDFRARPMTFNAWRKRYRMGSDGEPSRSVGSDQRAWDRLKLKIRAEWSAVVELVTLVSDDPGEGCGPQVALRVTHAARKRADQLLDYAEEEQERRSAVEPARAPEARREAAAQRRQETKLARLARIRARSLTHQRHARELAAAQAQRADRGVSCG